MILVYIIGIVAFFVFMRIMTRGDDEEQFLRTAACLMAAVAWPVLVVTIVREQIRLQR